MNKHSQEFLTIMTHNMVYAIIISVLLLGIGIADVAFGTIWTHCHLSPRHANVYLILSGSINVLFFVVHVFNENIKFRANTPHAITSLEPLIWCFRLIVICMLVWGTSIVWKSEQGDCNHAQYEYLYYRTLIAMFFNVVVFGMTLCLMCYYRKLLFTQKPNTTNTRQVSEV